MMLRRSLQTFGWILIFRILMVFLVNSSFVPDEYWQGPEVAHKLVFGYGHYTWEWITGLRSFVYPGFLSIPYVLLKYLSIDSRLFVMLVPRIQQAIVTAIGDFFFLRYCQDRYGLTFAKLVGWFYMTNWFITYCGARTLGNSMETSLNLVGLYLINRGRLNLFVILMVLNFVMRPSAVVYWIPYIPTVILTFCKKPNQLITSCLLALSILTAAFALDSAVYGKPTVSWWNFIDFNYIQGKSSLFGTHPCHWYLSNCLILLCGGHFVLFVIEVLRTLSQEGVSVFWKGGPLKMEMMNVFFYVGVYSLLGHKELRFMLPVVPNIILISASAIARAQVSSRQHLKKLVSVLVIGIAVFDIATLCISSNFHLNGVPKATEYVHNVIRKSEISSPRIWILMPCYSVPVFTQLHNPNATVEYFTCPPPELNLEMENRQDDDFSDIDLDEFVARKSLLGLPDFVIFFSPLAEKVKILFPGYEECFRAFNTFFPEGNVGEYVDVYCR